MSGARAGRPGRRAVDYLLLVLGAFVVAAVSGSAGFGGVLLLLPLLKQVVDVTEAVPLLTIVQIIATVPVPS